MAIFGLAATLLGAAGVYAVMTSFVSQQTRELGVRAALGATPGRLQRGVLSTASSHVALGFAIGAPVAYWFSQGFSALLFQVTPADISVYAVVAFVLVAMSGLAAWLPARRAARVDPMLSLRR
jgi:ABC-type antimicrobial peptide transport system permease subunit